MSEHPPEFYDALLKQVRGGLRAEGVKASAVGVLELRRAVMKWKVLSEDWEDAENYELNVKDMVRRFSRELRKAGFIEPVVQKAPRLSDLDPKHGVAYATADSAPLNVKVRAARLSMTGLTAPLFPWLEMGYGEARRQADTWLVQQFDHNATFECELVIRLTTNQVQAWFDHVNDVSNHFADDQEWQKQGQPLSPELGAMLFGAPDFSPPMVIVESFKTDEGVVRATGIVRRTVGPTLALPGESREVAVPLTGRLKDFYQNLVDTALTTSWWDTSHALEYVLTGHPPRPSHFRIPQAPKKVLSRKQVALLEAKHRLPDGSWRQRVDLFNEWCSRVEGLKRIAVVTAPQAMREEHSRAQDRALWYSTLVVKTSARHKLERPEMKFW